MGGKIEIEWLSDENDCETCGPSSAEGAIVKLDGVVILNMIPVAHCFGGANYSPEAVYLEILGALGYVIETR